MKKNLMVKALIETTKSVGLAAIGIGIVLVIITAMTGPTL